MNRILKSLIRISSFPLKELMEIFRQPRLIITLILGPFLIIFLFGVGYPDEGRSLRTTFVTGERSPFEGEMEEFTETVSPAIIYQGTEADEQTALEVLEANQTDIVIVFPDDPLTTIQNNQQARFLIYHNEIDPFQIALVRSIGRIYTDEVNRRIWMSLTDQGQDDIDGALLTLNEEFKDAIPDVSSRVLVSPFTHEFIGIAELEFTPVKYLTPSVIILLLQHLSITFASLSIVREKRSGIMELFRVSPLTAIETLLGKYFSYMVFGMFLGVMLTVLVMQLLDVPMLGSWTDYTLTLILLLFTSLGAGFLISLISETEIQAVQYSMLFLLASIFFSGFFLDLRFMWDPMRAFAWSLPATYGIRMLQDVMLRGYQLPALIALQFTAIGLLLFLVNLYLLRRKLEGST
jgi:ABC-2 type transport system permease protein